MALAYPRAILIAFGIVVCLGVVVAASTSGMAFGTHNPSWDGASELRGIADETGTDTAILRNSSDYESMPRNETLAVVLSPAERYGPVETQRVRQFVTDGGTLLLAADTQPASNQLLAALGVDARLDGRPLRDERVHGPSPAFPQATNISEYRYTRGVDSLTLNHGTSVVTTEHRGADNRAQNLTTVAATSPYAYHDGNANGRLDDSETIGSYPVVTLESLGAGRVIVVSDPSMFINAMLDMDGNRAFATILVANHDRVAMDVSHAAALPPLTALLLDLRASTGAQVLVGGAGILALSRWEWLLATAHDMVARRTPARSDPVDADAVVERVRARHPDWDPARVTRVTQGIIRTESKRSGDD